MEILRVPVGASSPHRAVNKVSQAEDMAGQQASCDICWLKDEHKSETPGKYLARFCNHARFAFARQPALQLCSLSPRL